MKTASTGDGHHDALGQRLGLGLEQASGVVDHIKENSNAFYRLLSLHRVYSIGGRVDSSIKCLCFYMLMSSLSKGNQSKLAVSLLYYLYVQGSLFTLFRA